MRANGCCCLQSTGGMSAKKILANAPLALRHN
jgi:hypothetical protein